MTVNLIFHGAAECVTGSCMLLDGASIGAFRAYYPSAGVG